MEERGGIRLSTEIGRRKPVKELGFEKYSFEVEL